MELNQQDKAEAPTRPAQEPAEAQAEAPVGEQAAEDSVADDAAKDPAPTADSSEKEMKGCDVLPHSFKSPASVDATGFDIFTALAASKEAAKTEELVLQEFIVRAFDMIPRTKGKGENKVILKDDKTGETLYSKKAAAVTMGIAMTSEQVALVQNVASQYAIESIFGPVLIKYANYLKRIAKKPEDEIVEGMTWTFDALAKYLEHDVSTPEGVESLVKHLFTGSYAPKSANIGSATDLKVCGLSEDSDMELSVAMSDATKIIENSAEKAVETFAGAITAAQAKSLAKWWKRGGKGQAPSGGSTMVGKALTVYKRSLAQLRTAEGVIAEVLETGVAANGAELTDEDRAETMEKKATFAHYIELYSMIECTLTSFLGALQAKEEAARQKKALKRQKAMEKAISTEVDSDDMLAGMGITTV